MTITRPANRGIEPGVHPIPRRSSSNRLQFTLELAASIVVISYVTMLLTVRLSYSIGSVSLYSWLECLVLLAPVIPILTRLRNHSSLRGAWLPLGLGILLFDLAEVLRLLSVAGVTTFSTTTTHSAVLVLSYLAIVMQQSYGPRAVSVRLDGLIAGLALAALGSTYWFHQYIEVSGRPLLAELNIFNPILVIVLLVLLIAGLVPSHFRPNRPTVWLVIGLISIGLGDLVEINKVVTMSHLVDSLATSSRSLGVCPES